MEGPLWIRLRIRGVPATGDILLARGSIITELATEEAG